MKDSLIRTIALLTILFSGFASFGQNYYWNHNQQIQIQQEPNHYYLRLSGISNENDLTALFTGHDLDIVEFQSMQTVEGIAHMAIVKSTSLTESDLDALNQIVYYGPYFSTETTTNLAASEYFLVKLRDPAGYSTLQSMATSNQVQIVGPDKYLTNWYILRCDKTSNGNSLEMANLFAGSGSFETSIPDFIVFKAFQCAGVSDQYYPDQWGLDNTGQHSDSVGIDIKACGAWSNTKGSANIVVAVIDDYVDPAHPDLAPLHPLSQEPGFEFDHGTPVAGIIAAQHNSIGVSGIAPDCPIMSLGVGAGFSSTSLTNAIMFAWKNGASVINNSWTYDFTNITEAIDSALIHGRNGLGCVVVQSSGNHEKTTVEGPKNPGILTVGAIDPCAKRIDPPPGYAVNPQSCYSWVKSTQSGSSYGSDLDVVAPGVLVPSTDRSGGWGEGYVNPQFNNNGDYIMDYSGTSAAAPHVSGVAALVLSVAPCLTNQQVNDIIEQSAQKVGGYAYALTGGRPNGDWHMEVGYGLVNADSAVKLALTYANPLTVTASIHDTICQTGEAKLIPSGGSGSYSYEWKDSTGTIIGATDTIFGLTSGRYYWKVYDGIGCAVSDSFYISTIEVIITGNGYYCIDDTLQQLSATTSGGAWTGIGVTDLGGGLADFDPGAAGILYNGSANFVTYTVGGCSQTFTDSIFVDSVGSFNLTGIDSSYCITDNSAHYFFATPDSGIWTGPGIYDYGDGWTDFFAHVTPPGTHVISYSYGACSVDTTVTVNGAFLAPAPSVFCNSDDSIYVFSADPQGGQWFGNGITDLGDSTALFNPQADTLNNIDTIYYELGGCKVIHPVTIQNQPSISISNSTPCYNDPTNLTATTSPSSNGNWYLNGSLIGSGSSISFLPSAGIIDTNELVFEPSGICGNDTLIYVASYIDTGTFIIDNDQLCNEYANVPINSQVAPLGGSFSYSPGGIMNMGDEEFTAFPDILGTGVHLITYSVTSGCYNVVLQDTLFVHDLPNVEFTGTPDACTDDTAIALVDYVSPTSGFAKIGIYDWAYFTVDGGASIFEDFFLETKLRPDWAAPGIYYIKYQVTDTNNCYAEDYDTVFIGEAAGITAHSIQHDDGASSGSISITPLHAGSSVLWSTGDAGNTVSGLDAGTYSVTVTNGDGCAFDTSFVIHSFDAGGDENGILACPGWIGPETTAEGLTYQWSMLGGGVLDLDPFQHPGAGQDYVNRQNLYSNPMQPATYVLETFLDGVSIGTDQVFVNVSYDADNATVNALQDLANIQKIRGVVTVDGNITINNRTFEFGPYVKTEKDPAPGHNHGIDIVAGATLTLDNVILKPLAGCEQEYLWRGIYVEGDNEDPCGPHSGELSPDPGTGPGNGKGNVGKVVGNEPGDDLSTGFEMDNNGNFHRVDREKILIERPDHPMLFIDLPGNQTFCIWHGKLVIRNSSVVQDANWGVYSDNNGIVDASDSYFENNNEGLHFQAGKLMSKSVVRNCTIRYDKPVNKWRYIDYDGAGIGITLDLAKGVQIADNLFKVDAGAFSALPLTARGTAIRSHDATYRVIQVRDDLNPVPAGDPVPVTGYGNRFENFYKGIDAYSIGSINAILVRSNTFDNCITGITTNGTAFDSITRNIFTVPEGTAAEPTYGIFLQGSMDYKVKENQMTSLGNGGYTFGIVGNGAQIGAAEMWKNEFFDVFEVGTQTEEVHSNLNLNCNVYHNSNASDVRIYDDIGGLLGNCGAIGTQLKNEFHPSCGSLGEHIWTNAGVSFVYNSVSGKEPSTLCKSGTITTITCPSLSGETCPENIEDNTSELARRRQFIGIASINGVQDLVILRRKRNDVIGQLIHDGKFNQALDLIYYRDDNVSKQLIANTYSLNGYYNEARAKADEITVANNSDQQTVDFVKTVANTMESSQYSESTIDANNLVLFNGYAWNNSTKVYAQSGLEYLNQEQYRRIPRTDVVSSAMVASPESESTETTPVEGHLEVKPELQIVPNPFHNSATISSDQEGIIILLDHLGRKVVEREMQSGKVEILASELNESGMYFVILHTNTGKVVKEKLIFER